VRRAPLAFAALAVVVTATVAACGSSGPTITTDAVRRATVTEIVDVPASVTARAAATLTSPADGTLTTLAVAPGARVAKGAVVAVVDSPSARKRLADATAALAAAGSVGAGLGSGGFDLTDLQNEVDAAAADGFAAARTAAAKIADPAVRDALLAQVDAAQKHYTAAAATSKKLLASVQQGLSGIGDAIAALGAAQRIQAKAAYDLAKSTVDALTLRAPIAGVVQYAHPTTGGSGDSLAGLLGAVGAAGGSGSPGGAVVAAGASGGGGSGQSVAGVDDVLSVGDLVSAGTPVVTIVDNSEIGLTGEVDETDVLLVSPGVKADVELDAAPGVRFQATVGTVDLLPTPSTRGGVAYRIRLSFVATTPAADEPAPPTPRPGMSAVAHLRVRTATDAVTVPAAAVFTSELGDTVWVVRDGKAARQQVKVGVQGEDLVQILSGVDVGQRVVVTGTDKVSAGQGLS
jgi:HlyD family secretion protein